jgi:hypothetical protein
MTNPNRFAQLFAEEMANRQGLEAEKKRQQEVRVHSYGLCDSLADSSDRRQLWNADPYDVEVSPVTKDCRVT